MFVLVSMGMERGLASGTLITLDAREDAGFYPGEEAYLKFVDYQNVNNVLLNVYQTDPQFASASDVYSYAESKGIRNWLLTSAGNIWSSDLIVGESLSGLQAGIYRVSPVDGAYMAYMYDSFGWDRNYRGKYWWELHIKGTLAYQNGQIVDNLYYMLGSYDGQTSADLALQAVLGSFIDIPLAEGGALSFWIWDWNSIDNSGGLSFNVTPIPEPSTLTLLGIGMLFLIRRIRKLAH
jgi:hypothetical protein